MNNEDETIKPKNDLGLRVEDALIAELEANLPPEEVDAWLKAFLRKRVE